MGDVWFGGWEGLGRIVMVGPAAYVALVVVLRITGKRTLSKLNAFDLVVTVALGSTLATTLLNNNVTLAQGALAFALLTLLQFVVTWLSVRSQRLHRVVTAEPRLLFFRGRFLEPELERERVMEQEVRSAIRGAGFSSLEQVGAVVLESDGSISVIGGGDGSSMRLQGAATSLRDVRTLQAGALRADDRSGGEAGHAHVQERG